MVRRVRIKDPWKEQQLFVRRSAAAALIVIALTIVVFARLWHLQVSEYARYDQLAEGNRIRIEPIPPTRGLIFDRDGVLLAENVPSYQLVVTPEAVTDMDSMLARLAEVVTLTEDDLRRFRRLLESQRRFDQVPVRFSLSETEVARFATRRQDFQGVDLVARLSRRYPLGAETAHVTGYVGRISPADLERLDPVDYAGTTHTGKIGLERTYEDLLHGQAGSREVLVNARGRPLRVVSTRPPVPGRDLYLSLDVDVQRAAAQALGERRGAVVAIDPRDGGVLALVSQPAYDPNPFVDGISTEAYQALREDRDQPLFNRAVAGRYPPGSTVKPIFALSGLHEHAVESDESVMCRGFFTLPDNERRYRDWERDGHGPVDLERSIARSCDVYYYELSLKLGIDRMANVLRAFGLGRTTGLDLTGERSGLVPDRDWKRRQLGEPWFHGETLIVGIGQGFLLATPLQLARATAALATRGRVLEPQLLARSQDGITGQPALREARVSATLDAFEASSWRAVQAAMEAVVNSPRGTARAIARRDLRIAGKSGTAQVFSLPQDEEEEIDPEELEERLRDHALFVAYAPAEAPRVAVAVIVENGGSGSGTAGPVARAVIDAALAEDTAP